jgi:hypothetical protein
MKWFKLAILPIIFLVSPVLAQNETEDSTDVDNSDDVKTLKIEFKPRIGIGIGMFTFYGDVASNNQGYHPTVSKLGYDLSITNPLTDYLDIKFYAMIGTVGANERTLTRNLNFQSDITTGGFVINYNFSHLLKSDRAIDPYIGIGLESVEFLSKTDLYDKNGNFYHYWSDGSIRDIDENDVSAASANLIYRDYTYETDLRELNLDDVGKYPERSIAIPVQIGANMNLGDRVKFRIGTSMHFTMTDLIDNVSGNSTGNRIGTKGKDKFLYTSFALTYDLKLDNTKKDPQEGDWKWNPEDCILDTLDEDEDGIADFCDKCQQTESGTEVDTVGCPYDDDNDLIYNGHDLELDSDSGAVVNNAGVTLTDEAIARMYDEYMDTSGKYDAMELETEKTTVTSAGGSPNGPITINQKKKEVIRVRLGTNEEFEITANQMSIVLSNNHFTKLHKGDTTIFFLGEFDNAKDAQKLANTLEEAGIEASISKTNLTDDGTLTVSAVEDLDEVKEFAEFPEGTLFRVQIGAYSNRMSPKVFSDAPDVSELIGSDGIVRYYSGEFSSPESASEHKINMIQKGYAGSFIIAFKDGKRIKLSDAGFDIENPQDDVIKPDVPDVNGINPELIKFKVQVGAFARDIPTEVLDLYLQIGKVDPKQDKEEGLIKYFIGSFSSYDEAYEFQKEVVREGLTDAFVVGDFNGRIITAQEAITLKGQ